jgi:hypothetical protein
MANYLSNVVRSCFGDKAIIVGTLVVDDAYTGAAAVTGLNVIDFVTGYGNVAGQYGEKFTKAANSATIAVNTGASGSSFTVFIIGH